MLDILAPRLANSGYQKSMRDNDLKTFSDRMSDDGRRRSWKRYALGRILRKVASDNEYLSDAIELINSEDPIRHQG